MISICEGDIKLVTRTIAYPGDRNVKKMKEKERSRNLNSLPTGTSNYLHLPTKYTVAVLFHW